MTSITTLNLLVISYLLIKNKIGLTNVSSLPYSRFRFLTYLSLSRQQY